MALTEEITKIAIRNTVVLMNLEIAEPPDSQGDAGQQRQAQQQLVPAKEANHGKQGDRHYVATAKNARGLPGIGRLRVLQNQCDAGP